MDTYLSEKEQVLVGEFIKNHELAEAVKKVLLADVYKNGVLKPGEKAEPTRNAAFGLFFSNDKGGAVTDEALGRELRAMAMGVHTIESAFIRMQNYVPKPANPAGGKNPAR